MWTNENTVAALGYVALIASLIGSVLYLERRGRLLAQVVEVKERLTAPPKKPTYKTVIQMNSDGSLVSLKSRFHLQVGEVVTVDGASGMIRSYVQGSRPLGLVVSCEVTFE